MVKTNCKFCGKEVIRKGYKPAVFCSKQCKGDWQRTQKPVDKEWLVQKYLIEKLSAFQIAQMVGRDPTRVYDWLTEYGIPIRSRYEAMANKGGEKIKTPLIGWGEHKPYWERDWLYNEYVVKEKSAGDIAKEQDCTVTNISFWLHKHKIQCRTIKEARAIKYWGACGIDNPMYNKKGELSSNWKGGVTPERQKFYNSVEWCKACQQVWKRDNAQCQRCFAHHDDGIPLHVHHIISFTNGELRADVNNLVLLCDICHRWVHSNQNDTREFLGLVETI